MANRLLYVLRARNWTKNILVLSGCVLALVRNFGHFVPYNWIACFASACLISSANYILNDYCDRNRDRFHPEKRSRAQEVSHLSPRIRGALYLILTFSGCSLAWTINPSSLAVSLAFIGCAIFYNLPPMRLKDRFILDIVCESLNCPLRILMGVAAVNSDLPVPPSWIALFWIFGIFHMTLKRSVEIQGFQDRDSAASYRSCFKYYEPAALNQTAVIEATTAILLFLWISLGVKPVWSVCAIPLALYFRKILLLAKSRDPSIVYPELIHRNTGIAYLVAALAMVLAF